MSMPSAIPHCSRTIILLLALAITAAMGVAHAQAPTQGTGMVTRISKHNFAETVERVEAAAVSRGLATLRRDPLDVGEGSARRIVAIEVGPDYGDALIAVGPTLALDWPPRVLIISGVDGRVRVVTDSGEFLAARHGLGAQRDALGRLSADLAAIRTAAD
jgi:uncharacterized protein (DUF302 family)